MLRLKLATDPRWADLASLSLEEILTDHAYCEQKAASTCISLIQNYPDREELVEKLSPIVTEEWGHFRMVLAELKKRKLRPGQATERCICKSTDDVGTERRSHRATDYGQVTYLGAY
jgi:tRNA-(ms[2]io[6]A)-hydroxylase